MAVRLQDRADIAALGVELAGELFRGKGLPQGHGVADDGILPLDAVQRDQHEVEHLVVLMHSVQEAALGVRHVHIIPLAAVVQERPAFVGVNLVQGERDSSRAPLYVSVGIAPAVQPGIDDVPEVELVGVGVGPLVDDREHRVLAGVHKALGCVHLHHLGERGDVLAPDTDARIHRRDVHGALVRDRHAKGWRLHGYAEVGLRDRSLDVPEVRHPPGYAFKDRHLRPFCANIPIHARGGGNICKYLSMAIHILPEGIEGRPERLAILALEDVLHLVEHLPPGSLGICAPGPAEAPPEHLHEPRPRRHKFQFIHADVNSEWVIYTHH